MINYISGLFDVGELKSFKLKITHGNTEKT